jgi:hypothetical protein
MDALIAASATSTHFLPWHHKRLLDDPNGLYPPASDGEVRVRFRDVVPHDC